MHWPNSQTVHSPTRVGSEEWALVKIGLRVLWIAIVPMLGVGCSPSTLAPTSKKAQSAAMTADDALVQFSLVSALAAGDYAGGVPLRKVLACGDFGIGTFSRLDGEMIVLDGDIYQALPVGAFGWFCQPACAWRNGVGLC